MRLTIAALATCLALGVPPAAAGRLDEEGSRAMAESVNRFAVDLYKATAAGKQNVFFSPYSVAAALGMTREGARGQTAAEMDKVFHYPSALASKQRALAEALVPGSVRDWGPDSKPRTVPAYALEIANALWGQEGFPFLDAFTTALKEHYGAPLHRIDFRQQADARKAINDWVEKATRDKIQDIVPEGLPSADTRLALANAIYFKANWAEKFSKRATKEGPWYGLEGEKTAELMRRVDTMRYAEDERVQLVEIPYKGHETSMVVVVPKAKDGIVELDTRITHAQLTAWLGALQGRKVDLKLPKWKFTYAAQLDRTLAALGMPSAFSMKRADFSGITTEEPLFIGAVLHKAFVAVDEEGTEAAAATVVMMRAGSAQRPATPVEVIADRPFLFLIRHKKTGAVLFLGRLMDPRT